MQLESLSRLVALVSFSLASVLSLSAASGDLDPGFITEIGAGLTPDSYPSFTSGTGATNAIALQSDGKIIAGGNVSKFNNTGGLTALKRLLPTGALDSSFNISGAGLAASSGQPEVNALLRIAGDKLYVGGTFSTYNDVNRSGIVRLNADGSLDTGFDASGLGGLNRYALALAEQPDGKLLVGGGFTSVNSTSRVNFARLNTDGSLDTDFAPAGFTTNGSVRDIAVTANGLIYVSGSEYIPARLRNEPILRRYFPNGSLDRSFNPVFGNDFGAIGAILALPDGRVIAGGSFALPGSTDIYNLACFKSDGALDTAFMANNAGEFDGDVMDLILTPEGRVLASGIFTLFNGHSRASIARFATTGMTDTTFAPVPYAGRNSGYLTHLYALATQPDGRILAGGWLNRVSDPGLETYSLVRFDGDSSTGAGTLSFVSSLFVVNENDGTATISVARHGGTTGAVAINYSAANGTAGAGDFTSASGSLSWADSEGGVKTFTVAITNDATVESQETVILTLSGSPSPATLGLSAATLALADDDSAPVITQHPASVSLEQGASFTVSVRYSSILPATIQWQYDADGTGPLLYTDVLGATGTSYTVANAAPETHAGAYRAVVTSTAGATHSTAATISISIPAGSVDLTTFTSSLTGGIIKAVRDSSGRYVVATSTSVYRLTATGSVDATFATATFSNAITDLIIIDDGKILVSGFFTTVNATSRVGLARLNTDGSFDTSFNLGLTHSVQSLATGAGSKLYIGGTQGNGLKRFTSAGVLDATFGTSGVAAGIGTHIVNGYVWAIQELSDGRILVSHTTTNSSLYRLQILSATGVVDTSFNVPTLNWNIYAWDFLPDGRIAIAGRFSTIDGKTTSRLAILNTNGSLDSTFQVGTGPLGSVVGVRYLQGRLLAWGEFTTVNGTTPRGLARFNLDGSLDTSFSVGAGANTSVYSLIVTPTGDFDIFGNFTTFKGVSRSYAARLVGNPHVGAIGFVAPRVTTVEAGAPFALTLRRYGPAAESVSINYATADATSGDSATAGADYTGAAGTVSWAAGDSADKVININLLNDSDEEPTKGFRVLLTDASGPVTAAAPATVTLLDDDTPVSFTAQPTGPGSALFAGGSLTLTAPTVTSPTSVTYQWFLNGIAIPGATSAAYTKNPVSAADAGLYTLVVTNAAGSFSSSVIHVVVAPQPGRVASGQAASGRPSFTSGGVQNILALADGSALVGGFFSANPSANIPQGYLIRVKPDGSTDTSFTLSLGNNVRALLAQPDGKILIAGDFTFVNSVAQRFLYRLNADLTPDTAFNSAVATAIAAFSWGQPSDVAIDSTGRIYLGFNNGSTGSVWRFSSAGVLDDPYTLTTSTISFGGGGVTVLAMQSDDKLLVGGNFTRLKRFSDVANTDKNRLARVNTDGSIDTGFTATLSTLPISDLLVTSTGRIFIAGGTGSGTNLVEVSATDGTTQTGGSSGNLIYEIAFGPDGRLTLARASSSGLNSVSRLNIPAGSTTSNDTTFNVGTGPNNDVAALAYTTDNSLWIAGSFTTFNGFASGGVVKLQGSVGDPGIVNQPVRTDVNVGGEATLAVGATGTNLTYQWFKDGDALSNDTRISGSTTAILAITGLIPSDDDTYTVQVTGGTPAATATSAAAKLNVLAAPVVASSPASVTPALGSTITLAADVLAASPADYVWTRDGVVIRDGGRYSGATTGTLVISGANSADNGAYSLTVTNDLDDVTTTPATVTVAQTPSALFTGFPGLGAASAGSTSNNVNAILHLPDGRTLLGGSGAFRGIANTNVAYLGLVDSAGNLTTTLAGAFDGEVKALQPVANGKILVAGNFTSVGGVARSRLARLNADLSLDTSFVPPAANNTITLVAIDTLGRIYLYGFFNTYGGQAGYNNLVRLTSEGALDLDLKANIAGTVNALIPLPGGKLLLGGTFFNPLFNEVQATGHRLIRLNADATHDTTFTHGLPSGDVTAVAVDSSGRIVASGYDSGTYYIKRLQPNGAVDSSFAFTESLGGERANNLFVQPDGKILVGGQFTTPAKRILRLNTDGTRDTGFDVGTGLTHTSDFSIAVYAIAPDTLGRIWIGGSRFTSYNGATANALAILQGQGPVLAFTSQPTGQTVDLGTSVQFSATATGNNALTYQWKKNGTPLSNGSRISGVGTTTLTIANIAAGDAADYSVTVTSASATLTSNTAVLTILAEPEITGNPVSITKDVSGSATFAGSAKGAATLAYQWFHGTTPLANGTVSGVTIVGATTPTLTVSGLTFAQAGEYKLRVSNNHGSDTTDTAILTVERRPGAIAPGLPTISANGEVNAILRLADGSMLVGGGFTTVTVNGIGNSRGRIARFLADGSLDTSFTPSFNSTVRSLAQDTAGRIFVGGDFTAVTFGFTTTSRLRVARLTSGLILDTAFDTSVSGPNGNINAVTPVGDGGVYVGGAFGFNKVGAATVNRIARLKTSGALDTAFTAAAGVNNEVKALLRRSDGKLYAAGTFGTSLLTAAGAVDSGFSAGFLVQGQALLQLADSSLLIGANNTLLRVNQNTGATLDNYSTSHFIYVAALATQANGKILSGSYGILKRTNPATDTDDSGFGSFDNYIKALAVDGAGRIWVGGTFGNYNSSAQSRLAILNGGEYDSRNGDRLSQTITFASITNRTFGDAPFNLAATSSSGLAVTYSVVDGNAATVSGNQLTLIGAGSVTIRASQAGDDTYAAAPSVERTFTVSKAAQTITFGTIPPKVTGSAPFTVSATASSGLSVSFAYISGPATLDGNTVTLTGPGTVTLRASQSGDADYSAAPDVDRVFTVNAIPVITTQPVAAFKVVGSSAVFRVVATGSPAPTYQWRRNGANISGATSATYTISKTASTHAGDYTVVVKNAAGSVTSAVAKLTFGTAPKITSQPVAAAIVINKPVTFKVTATGSSTLRYQWRFKGGNITGATSSSYAISGVSLINAGDYSVVITNAYGAATSANARLTIKLPPTITTQPIARTVVVGSSVSFNVVASGSPTLTYQWRRNGTNITGATAATYTISKTASGNAGDYSVVVKNSSGSATSSVARLAFGTLPKITTQPTARTVLEGGSTTFSVTATGSPAVTYQWRRNGTDIPLATAASYTLDPVTETSGGNYTVVVRNAVGSVTSSVALLTVTPAPDVIHAPLSLPEGAAITYNGEGVDSLEGPYSETKTVTTGPGNTIDGGTFTYEQTGDNTATITYEMTTEESDYTETETSTVFITFTSDTEGTYTSSGDYEGSHMIDGPYSGTFTGSGAFTYDPAP